MAMFGVAMKNALIEYWRKKHRLNGYQEIESPIMLNQSLWERSGHWKLFKENMYLSEVDKGQFAMRILALFMVFCACVLLVLMMPISSALVNS